MKHPQSSSLFRKILVPILYGCDERSALAMARAIAGNSHIVLAGIVRISEGDSLSTAALPVRQVRKTLAELKNSSPRGRIRIREQVRVSHTPWAELVQVIESESPDLLLLEWPCHFDALKITPDEVFAHPLCDIAVIGGRIPIQPERILVPLRGGPFAELALRLSLSLAGANSASLASLHIIPEKSSAVQDVPFRGIDRILRNLPEVERKGIITDNSAEAIMAFSRQYDLVVMGATAQSPYKRASIGPVADNILRESKVGVIVVKTKRPMPANLASEESGHTAISVLVDKWFAENTYHADEFANLENMLDLKRRRNLSISLALTPITSPTSTGLATATPTVVSQSPGSTQDSCNKALTAWDGPTAKLNLANETKPKGLVTLSLYVVTERGECGYLSQQFDVVIRSSFLCASTSGSGCLIANLDSNDRAIWVNAIQNEAFCWVVVVRLIFSFLNPFYDYTDWSVSYSRKKQRGGLCLYPFQQQFHPGADVILWLHNRFVIHL